MKKTFQNLAESAMAVSALRALVRALVWVGAQYGRLWSFVRVRALLRVPPGSSCHWSVEFKYPENIRIAGRIMMSPDCVIGAKAPITFGTEVRLSQGVHLETASLDLNSGLPYAHIAKPIEIGDGVWLGAHSIVLAGVRIGANAVIGAGAVVSKDVPAGAVIVGSGMRTIERKAKYGQ